MKAKCPECGGSGEIFHGHDGIDCVSWDCGKCNGTGFLEARFAEGILWTRDCQNPECQMELTGSICKPGEEPGSKEGEFENPPACIFCGGETKWTNEEK